MKYSKWVGLLSVALLFIASFQPWVLIVSKNIIVTGMNGGATNFGKPALMNLFVSVIAAVFFLVPSIMAKRANLFFCAFNLAWSLRDYIIVSTCRAGECPEQKFGLYLFMFYALLIMIAAFLPDVKLDTDKPSQES